MPKPIIHPEWRRASESLSPVNGLFLDYVEAHPECLCQETFADLESAHELALYPLQPWPIFVTAEQAESMGQVAAGLSQLLLTLPERMFGSDAEGLAKFYGLQPKDANFIARILQERHLMRDVLTRGDFIVSKTGMHCLEVNMTCLLGGLETSTFAAAYRRNPTIQNFLKETGLQPNLTESGAELFEFLYDEARALATEGAFNVAILLSSSLALDSAAWQRYFEAFWQNTVSRRGEGLDGQVIICTNDELDERGEKLFLHGQRIHAMLEYQEQALSRNLLIPWMAGNLRLLNGPLTGIQQDKRNLALLSEFAETDLFSSEERALIMAHIPWNRRIRKGRVRYRGERRSIPELLRTEQRNLVLKPTHGCSGAGVLIGAESSAETWEKAVAGAVSETDRWIAQERIESLPLPFQSGPKGCTAHTAIWGLFAFGSRRGGGFLRMAPNASSGIVSSLLGAREGIFFEL